MPKKQTEAGKILRLAANEGLAATQRQRCDGKHGQGRAKMSCIAVNYALTSRKYPPKVWILTRKPLYAFLEALGLDTNDVAQFPRQDDDNWEEIQCWRYSWLMFAADIADEWELDLVTDS